VDLVSDPLFLRRADSDGNQTLTSGSVARNFEYEKTEAVYFLLDNLYKFSSYVTGNTIHLRSAAKNSDH
jgi:hypothetical protein